MTSSKPRIYTRGIWATSGSSYAVQRAPTVSLRFIYIQQYTEPQPTPKHTYTNHSRHVKLNLTQSTAVHECMCVYVCLQEGWGEGKVPKNTSSFSMVSRGAFSEIIRPFSCSISYVFLFLFCSWPVRSSDEGGPVQTHSLDSVRGTVRECCEKYA